MSSIEYAMTYVFIYLFEGHDLDSLTTTTPASIQIELPTATQSRQYFSRTPVNNLQSDK